MSISSAIQNAHDLTTLRQILEYGKSEENTQPAKCSMSFFCQEQVRVPGYTGSIHLWVLIDKVLNLVKNAPSGPYEFPEKERPNGEAIVKLIGLLEKEADKQYESACCVTRFFWKILGAIPSLYFLIRYNQVQTDWHEDLPECIFTYYTKNQYIAQFKQQPSLENIACRLPDRWLPPSQI